VQNAELKLQENITLLKVSLISIIVHRVYPGAGVRFVPDPWKKLKL
jgi:hypothetical protein